MKLISRVDVMALGVAVSMIGLWYLLDRQSFVADTCKIGLPNFSRPSAVLRSDLGCAVLGRKVRVTGILQTGPENSAFSSKELGPAPRGGGFTASTWYTLNQTTSRNDALDRQLSVKIPGLCRTGLAKITVEGWPTISAGRFGHMGMYSREFFEDRVNRVEPPPASLVRRMRADRQKAGLADCDKWSQ